MSAVVYAPCHPAGALPGATLHAPTGGSPLAPTVRREMEARLGHSFADVRVHSDARAASEAKALGARAFTIGRHLWFGERQFAPGTPAGRALLGHELAHVVQQRGPGDGGSGRAQAEADRAGSAVVRGRSFAPVVRTGPLVALQPEGEGDSVEATVPAELRDVAAARQEFEQERLAFARERVAATTLSISRAATHLRERPEAERPALRTSIVVLERELADDLGDTADLLRRRIGELEARAAGGENVRAEASALRRELEDVGADITTLRGIFSPEKGAAFEDVYRNKVAGLHCMEAAYAGLGALTSPARSAEVQRHVAEKARKGLRRKHQVDLDQFITVMDTANADKIAGPKQRAAWSRKHKTWTPTLQSIILRRVDPGVPGYYFFGLALAEAYHSVMIGVSTWETPARMLWCDQHGCQQVKGTLDSFARGEAEAYQIAYGDWDTYLWQVLPPAAASLFEQEGSP